MNWFEEWFDENYLELYSQRDLQDAETQVKLIIQKIGKPEGRWLDVGCGMGRYTSIFNRLGYPITGIDISRVLVEEGQKQHPDLDIRLVQIDDLVQEKTRYQVILSLFTSFGYFEEDRENLNFLQAMGNVAKPGGYLWLDFLNTKKLLMEPLTDTVFQGQSGKTFHQHRRINSITSKEGHRQNRIEKEIMVYDRQGKFLKKYQESVRLFTLEDFIALLPQAGFMLKEIYGDYQGGKYIQNSPRLIIWGEKIAV